MKKSKCAHCGANVVEYKHRLGKGLVSALTKLYKAGSGAHKIVDIGLTKAEYCNIQKLKYWGMIEKVNAEEDKINGGSWKITDHGIRFLRHEYAVPENVITFRGKIIRFEGKDRYITQIVTVYDKREFYIDTAKAPSENQGELFR